MQIGSGGNDAARRAAEEAARRRAAEEAARKAAEEAARKAAQEAARKAAEEAARKAAEAAARKAAEAKAKKAAEAKAKERLAGYAKPKEPKVQVANKAERMLKLDRMTHVQAAEKPKVHVTKPAERTVKVAVAKKPEEKQGFFGRIAKDIGGKVASGAKSVGKAIDHGVDKVNHKLEDAGKAIAKDAKQFAHGVVQGAKAVDAGIDKVDKAIGAGVHKVDKAIDDGIKAGGRTLMDKAIDPALDKSVLGKDDQGKNEKAGTVGKLVTNRLEPGESVFLKMEADTQFAGVQVGAGAQAEVKRVPKTDEKGEAVTEPKDEKGHGPTEIEVSLMVEANAGVGIQAELGKLQKGQEGGGFLAGANAGAGAEAQAGVTGQVEFKFRFDPTKEKDMEAMTGIFKSASKSGLESAIPGIGMALAASNAPDVAKDAQAFASHLTEVRGEAGVYANASANADLSVGIHKKDGEADPLEGAKEEKSNPLEDLAMDHVLEASKLDVANLSAAVGGELKVGASKDLRSDKTTLYLTANGQAEASGGVMGTSQGVGGSDSRTMAITVDKQGEIVGASVQKTMTKEEFKGLGKEDLQGRRISSKALARLKEEDSVTVTYEMRPDALTAFKKQMKDQPASAVAGMIGQGYKLDPEKLRVADVTGSHVTQAELGAEVMGNQLKATVGHGQEVALDPGLYGGDRINSGMAEHAIVQRASHK